MQVAGTASLRIGSLIPELPKQDDSGGSDVSWLGCLPAAECYKSMLYATWHNRRPNRGDTVSLGGLDKANWWATGCSTPVTVRREMINVRRRVSHRSC
jgi:hypothetical protein